MTLVGSEATEVELRGCPGSVRPQGGPQSACGYTQPEMESKRRVEPHSALGMALLLLCCAPAPAADLESDYPQWRGQRRDGAASAFAEPAEWPETLTRSWSIEVGEGYATPLVIGDVVYAFTRRVREEVLTAIELGSGREIWRTGYELDYTPGRPASAHGAGPKATPVYADSRLFTLGISGVVSGFDASSGELQWQTEAPEPAPFFSAASSPLVHEGLVIAHPGNYGPLTAFDAETGEVRWAAGKGGFFASPLVAELAGIRQLVTITQDSVIGVSPADGRVLWEHAWEGKAGGPMPVLHGEVVIVSGHNRGVAAFKPVHAGGEWSTATLWETKEASMYLSNPVVIDGVVYGFSHLSKGQFFALDAETGVTLWLGEPRQTENSAVVKAGDLLMLLNTDGQLIVTRGDRQAFTPIQRYTVSESATWAQPAVSANRILIKDTSLLTLWTLE